MTEFSLFFWAFTAMLFFGSVLLVVRAFKGVFRRKGDTAKFCKSCGHTGKPRIVTGGSIWIELVLWLCFIVPGLVYSLWRLTRRGQRCEKCDSTDLVPTDSPIAVATRKTFGIT
jgi:hypothetical protein